MIKFFRQIRQNLLSEGKTGRYFKYAIGEIVLVVIGILIALQVNNWNEERKEDILQQKILHEIARNIDLDLVEIRHDISLMDSVNSACQRILNHLEHLPEPSYEFNYDMATIRANPHFDPNTSGYSLLVSKGVEIVKNDSLRELISVLYESNYPYYKRYEEERTQYKIQHIYPRLLSHTTLEYRQDLYFRAVAKVSQKDYDNLRTNEAFMKFVHATSYENSIVQDRARVIETKILGLKELLKRELPDQKEGE